MTCRCGNCNGRSRPACECPAPVDWIGRDFTVAMNGALIEDVFLGNKDDDWTLTGPPIPTIAMQARPFPSSPMTFFNATVGNGGIVIKDGDLRQIQIRLVIKNSSLVPGVWPYDLVVTLADTVPRTRMRGMMRVLAGVTA